MTPSKVSVWLSDLRLWGGRHVTSALDLLYDRLDEVEVALSQARQDIETVSTIIRAIRSWPPSSVDNVASPATDLRS